MILEQGHCVIATRQKPVYVDNNHFASIYSKKCRKIHRKLYVCSMNISNVRNKNIWVGTKTMSYLHLFAFRTAAKSIFIQFTLYPLIQFKSLLKLRVLKIDPSVLGF